MFGHCREVLPIPSSGGEGAAGLMAVAGGQVTVACVSIK